MKLAVAATAVLLAAACGVQQSGLDANAAVTISGKALNANGQPLASTRVVLIKELDLGEAIGGLFVTAVTLGIACLADHPPALCANNSHVTTTDAAGGYSFTVKGGDTQGSLGLASTMEVMARAPARASEINGPLALMEFTAQTASLTLPDLRVWQPAFTPAGPTQRSAWPELPADYGNSPSYSLEFYDLHGNPWWVSGSVKPGDWVDGRVLEDMNGAVDVAAHAHTTASGTTVDLTYVSGSVSVHGRSGAPPSRRAPCAPLTASGVGAFNASCALTSGSLGGGPGVFSAATGAVIDMGREGGMTLIVVRGCPGQCRLAISSDLSDWSGIGAVSGPYATTPVTLNRSARYVRIEATPNVASVRQVSVW